MHVIAFEYCPEGQKLSHPIQLAAGSHVEKEETIIRFNFHWRDFELCLFNINSFWIFIIHYLYIYLSLKVSLTLGMIRILFFFCFHSIYFLQIRICL